MLYVLKGIPVYQIHYKEGHAAVNGDIACNSYYKLDEDVNLLKDLGVSNKFKHIKIIV